MMKKLDQKQARALAAFISTLRPDWDPTGVYVALGRARDLGDPAAVAVAAIRAASTPTNRTPAVIALHGDHWAGTPTTTNRGGNPANRVRCDVHSLELPCRGCRADALVDGTLRRGDPLPPPPAEPAASPAHDPRALAAGKD